MTDLALDLRTADWIAKLLAGDFAALARAITAVENHTPDTAPILRAIQPHVGRAVVVGITGAPGVGKSSLINAYIGELRRRGRTVGVVAVDPSSPFTGGALLGDRVRMNDHAEDLGVFVRSLASRGQWGGLSPTTARVVDVMDAAGKDVVIVETVGTGQSEIAIADLADVKVVVAAPGLGDAMQAGKAGILEIADVLAVNKCDRPGAEAAVQDYRGLAQLRHMSGACELAVLATSATQNIGIAELAAAIDGCVAAQPPRDRQAHARRRLRHVLADLAGRRLRERIREGGDKTIDALCDAVQRGDLDIAAAVDRLANG